MGFYKTLFDRRKLTAAQRARQAHSHADRHPKKKGGAVPVFMENRGNGPFWRDACVNPTSRGYFKLWPNMFGRGSKRRVARWKRRPSRVPAASATDRTGVRKAYARRLPSTTRIRMKGVGKFGEVMAGEKGKVSYDDVAARLMKIIHSGSQRKAITDFVCRELRKIPHYTWVGFYVVDGSELVLASWSGPSATLH